MLTKLVAASLHDVAMSKCVNYPDGTAWELK